MTETNERELSRPAIENYPDHSFDNAIYYLFATRFFLIIGTLLALVTAGTIAYIKKFSFYEEYYKLELSQENTYLKEPKELIEDFNEFFQKENNVAKFIDLLLESPLPQISSPTKNAILQQSFNLLANDIKAIELHGDNNKYEFTLKLALPFTNAKHRQAVVKSLNQVLRKSNDESLKKSSIQLQNSLSFAFKLYKNINKKYANNVSNYQKDLVDVYTKINEIEYFLLKKIRSIPWVLNIEQKNYFQPSDSNKEYFEKLPSIKREVVNYLVIAQKEHLLSADEAKKIKDDLLHLNNSIKNLNLNILLTESILSQSSQSLSSTIDSIAKSNISNHQSIFPTFSEKNLDREKEISENHQYFISKKIKLLIATTFFLIFVISAFTGIVYIYYRDNKTYIFNMIKKNR